MGQKIMGHNGTEKKQSITASSRNSSMSDYPVKQAVVAGLLVEAHLQMPVYKGLGEAQRS